MKLKGKQIKAGERMPKFYGLAYWDYNMDIAICYPIPLNLFSRWLYDLTFWLKNPSYKDRRYKYDTIFHKGYNKGYWAGREAGGAEANSIADSAFRVMFNEKYNQPQNHKDSI